LENLMNPMTMLFTGLLLAGIGIFGQAVKAIALSVLKPLGGQVRKVSSILFGIVVLLLGALTAGVSLSILTPDIESGVTYGLLLAFLCGVSGAIQVKLAFKKNPEDSETVEESAVTYESSAAVQLAAPEQPVSTVTAVAVVASAASSTEAIPKIQAVAEEVDAGDAWVDEQEQMSARESAVILADSSTITAAPGVAPVSKSAKRKSQTRTEADLVDQAELAEALERAEALLDMEETPEYAAASAPVNARGLTVAA
jgi:hypothetical protein